MNNNLNEITNTNSNNNYVDIEDFFKNSPNLFNNNNINRLQGMKEFTFNNFKNSSMK